MASSLRSITHRRRATHMPAFVRSRRRAAEAALRRRGRSVFRAFGRRAGCAARVVRRGRRFGKGGARAFAVGILQTRGGLGGAVRKKGTGAGVCPGLLRGVDETVRGVAESTQATETPSRASLGLLSEELSAKPRPRRGHRRQRCQSFITTLSRRAESGRIRRMVGACGLRFAFRTCVPRAGRREANKRELFARLVRLK